MDRDGWLYNGEILTWSTYISCLSTGIDMPPRVLLADCFVHCGLNHCIVRSV